MAEKKGGLKGFFGEFKQFITRGKECVQKGNRKKIIASR